METSLDAAKTQFDSAQAQAASYKAELSQKSGAKPLIIESLDKANAALEKARRATAISSKRRRFRGFMATPFRQGGN